MTVVGAVRRSKARRLLWFAPTPLDRCLGALLLGVAGVVAAAIVRHDRNFWYDEAMLVEALRGDRWLPPGVPMSNFEQAEPYGAYLLQKGFLTIVGFDENLLRIPGLVAWVVAGLATWIGARKLLGPGGAFIAGLLVLTAGPAVVEAGDFKHYSFELAASAVIIAWTLRLTAARPSSSGVRRFALTSGALMLFSNTAILVFAGSVATLLLHAWRADRSVARTVVLWGAGVVLAFGGWYLFVLKPAFRFQLAYPTYVTPTPESFLQLVGLLPLPSSGFVSAFWAVTSAGLVLLVVIRRDLLLVVALPAIVILTAGVGGVVGAIPFQAIRHVLFLVPCTAMIGAAAFAAIASLRLPGLRRRGYGTPGAVVVVIVAMLGAALLVRETLPSARISNQAFGAAVQIHRSECDGFWVDWWAQPAATVYAARAGTSALIHGAVSTASGSGQEAWAYRLRNAPQAWQQSMVDRFRTHPDTCLLIGSRPDEVGLALDPLKAAGLPCTPLAALPDTNVYRCRTPDTPTS